MNVTEAGRRSTRDLVDGAAHDAGLVDKDHHVQSSALAKSGTQLHKERNDEGTKTDVATSVGVDGMLGGVAHGAGHAGNFMLEGGAEVLSIAWLAYECVHALVGAENKGTEIKEAFDNDAVNVAIAGNLAFDPAFGALEQAARPGVKTGTGKLTQVLQDPSNPTKLVLQARADEGYLAAERAMKATASLPEGQRGTAIAQWFKDNGYAARMKDDVAFAKGVEYHAFVQGAAAEHKYSINADAERAKVEARVPVERPLMVRP